MCTPLEVSVAHKSKTSRNGSVLCKSVCVYIVKIPLWRCCSSLKRRAAFMFSDETIASVKEKPKKTHRYVNTQETTIRCDASCVYERKRPWSITVYQRRRDKVAGVRLERNCTGWLAWRNNRLVCFEGLAHQFLQTLFQTGLPGVRRRQHLPWLVIRLHCVSRKGLQHWRRNSWKRPAYMPSCHALVGAQETDSTHAHHSSDQLIRTASLYFGRLDELTTSISHEPRATSSLESAA